MSEEEQPRGRQSGPIPRTFRLRLILTISAVFLVPMAIFLVVSFTSEKRRHLDQTFEHLDETLGVLSLVLRDPAGSITSELTRLEEGLVSRTGIPHRIVITDATGRILAAAVGAPTGTTIDSSFELRRIEGSPGDESTGRYAGELWLASSSAVGDGDAESVLFLLRERAHGDRFLRQFLTVHGLHVAVTLIAFLGLVQVFGTRYVTRPIRELAAHIRQVEAGDFSSNATPTRHDEFGWLAERFTAMGCELQQVVRRLVRSEKYASAAIVSYRVARELMEPLGALNRHILYLEGILDDDEDRQRVLSSLRRDRESIVKVIERLQDIQAPEGTTGG